MYIYIHIYIHFVSSECSDQLRLVSKGSVRNGYFITFTVLRDSCWSKKILILVPSDMATLRS